MDTQTTLSQPTLAELIKAVEAEGPASTAVAALVHWSLNAQHALKTGGQWFIDIANSIT